MEGLAVGVLSIRAIIFDVSDEAADELATIALNDKKHVLPAVIIFRSTFGRDGPTEPCCAINADGSSLKSRYSSYILTESRSRALFSSSLNPSSGHEANTSRVRFPCRLNSDSRAGRAAVVIVVVVKSNSEKGRLLLQHFC